MQIRFARLLLPALLILSTIVAGCSALGMGGTGEPASAADATPPQNYAPIYVQRIGRFSPDAENATVQVTRVDAVNPTHVKLYAHIVNADGTYLSGATAEGLKLRWCEVQDESNGNSEMLTNYTLREVTQAEYQPHAIAVVMDHSGSMGEARARVVQDAVERLVLLKKNEDELSFIKYDDDVKVEIPMTKEAAMLRLGFRKEGLSGYGGMTAVGNGIHAGIEQAASSLRAERKAVIVFTDGLDNSSTISRDSVIAKARREGVVICAVDFGENTNPEYLKAVAEGTGGSYYKIYSTSEFDLVFADIYRRLRNYYVLEYSPKSYGPHAVTMKLCLDRDSLTAVANYDNTPDVGTVGLLNVYFDVAKSDLKAESKPALDDIESLMEAFPDLRIELRGHTDSTNSTGNPNFNTELSQNRADAVRDELVKRGIPANRISAVGYGESDPVADNGTAEGRARNRRTEFVILSL